MTGSCDDIQQYLNIVDGNFDKKEVINESKTVDLGISTGGASVGQVFHFEEGIKWARIIEEEGDHWLIEHGIVEYPAEMTEYISKFDLKSMINDGMMVLQENSEEIGDTTDALFESIDSDEENFDDYINRVDRYLLVNENRESHEYSYDWREALSEGKTPQEAADEAILFEVI